MSYGQESLIFTSWLESDVHFQYWQNFIGHDDKDWQTDSTTLNVTGTCDTGGKYLEFKNE